MNCDVYRAKPAAYIIQVDVYSMIFRLPWMYKTNVLADIVCERWLTM
jgi:hypothetical protein